MFHIVLFEPEIPPNTGNIIRLSAATACQLHLVEPLGFSVDHKSLRRAGLDYHQFAEVHVHQDWPTCRQMLRDSQPTPPRFFAMTTKGKKWVHQARFSANDVLLFGPETRGLPEAMLAEFSEESRLRLPMTEPCRSLNLSNAVAIVVYEAWRQLNFDGAV